MACCKDVCYHLSNHIIRHEFHLLPLLFIFSALGSIKIGSKIHPYVVWDSINIFSTLKEVSVNEEWGFQVVFYTSSRTEHVTSYKKVLCCCKKVSWQYDDTYIITRATNKNPSDINCAVSTNRFHHLHNDHAIRQMTDWIWRASQICA